MFPEDSPGNGVTDPHDGNNMKAPQSSLLRSGKTRSRPIPTGVPTSPGPYPRNSTPEDKRASKSLGDRAQHTFNYIRENKRERRQNSIDAAQERMRREAMREEAERQAAEAKERAEEEKRAAQSAAEEEAARPKQAQKDREQADAAQRANLNAKFRRINAEEEGRMDRLATRLFLPHADRNFDTVDDFITYLHQYAKTELGETINIQHKTTFRHETVYLNLKTADPTFRVMLHGERKPARGRVAAWMDTVRNWIPWGGGSGDGGGDGDEEKDDGMEQPYTRTMRDTVMQHIVSRGDIPGLSANPVVFVYDDGFLHIRVTKENRRLVSLRDAVTDKDQPEVNDIVRGVIAAIQSVHTKGYVNGDCTVGNIQVDAATHDVYFQSYAWCVPIPSRDMPVVYTMDLAQFVASLCQQDSDEPILHAAVDILRTQCSRSSRRRCVLMDRFTSTFANAMALAQETGYDTGRSIHPTRTPGILTAYLSTMVGGLDISAVKEQANDPAAIADMKRILVKRELCYRAGHMDRALLSGVMQPSEMAYGYVFDEGSMVRFHEAWLARSADSLSRGTVDRNVERYLNADVEYSGDTEWSDRLFYAVKNSTDSKLRWI